MNTDKSDRLLPYLTIVAAAFIPFINSLSNTFAWDDIYLIVKNPYIKGWHNVADLFSTGYWESIGKTGGLYRPLTMMSFLIEHSIAGLNPLIYHLDNIMLHVACSIAVYLVLRRLLSNGPAPLFGALLFAVHPVHSEAVAWVSGRAELLSTLFFMLAFMSFIRPPRHVPWYVASPTLYLLGILSKETAATLPAFILFYLLFVRKERGIGALARSVAPFAAVLALYTPARLAVLGGHVGPQTQMFQTVKTYYVFLTMLKAGFHYVRLSFFPTNLQLAYIFPPPESFLDPAVFAFAAIITALLLISPGLCKTRPSLLFLGAWFFIALIPVSNIIPTEVIMTERALYLPTVGTCSLLGIAFAGVIKTAPRKVSYGFLSAALACLCLVTINRNAVWKDQRSVDLELAAINQRLVRDFPDNPKAYIKLGESCLSLGRIAEAGPLFEEALRIAPDDADAHFGLASVYRAEGRLDDALSELSAAIKYGYTEPDTAYVNMASILYDLGKATMAQEHLNKALELNPQNALAHLNMGYLLLDKGLPSDALADFAKAGRLDPELFEAFYQKGLVLGGMGEFDQAVAALETAASLRPDDPSVYLYLGAAYESMGRLDKARAAYNDALRINPGFSPASERLKAITGN